MARKTRVSSEKKSRQRRERRHPFAAVIPRPRKRDVGRSTTRETPLHVRSRGFELDDGLRDYIRDRTAFKLGKYALSITRITVRIVDVAGPTGAPTWSCRFKIVLPTQPAVAQSVEASSPKAAFNSAVDATERAVRRALQARRKRRIDHRRPA
jgi:ribosome-associated translation inhibitor RaiA